MDAVIFKSTIPTNFNSFFDIGFAICCGKFCNFIVVVLPKLQISNITREPKIKMLRNMYHLPAMYLFLVHTYDQ